jgi:hypothetical protein
MIHKSNQETLAWRSHRLLWIYFASCGEEQPSDGLGQLIVLSVMVDYTIGYVTVPYAKFAPRIDQQSLSFQLVNSAKLLIACIPGCK